MGGRERRGREGREGERERGEGERERDEREREREREREKRERVEREREREREVKVLIRRWKLTITGRENVTSVEGNLTLQEDKASDNLTSVGEKILHHRNGKLNPSGRENLTS